MSIAGGLLVAVVVVLVALSLLQVRMQLAGRRQIGRPAPPLHGLPSTGSALIYFYSPTCGPCRSMSPTVAALAAEGRAVLAVDVTRRPEVAAAFSVMATPTTVAVRDGATTDLRLGVLDRAELEQLLSR